jgi:hypothetical protein
MIILRYMGLAGKIEDETSSTPIGSFLMSYDPEAHEGRGHTEFTDVLDKAIRFSSVHEAIEFIRQVPKNKPTRPDGKPNRPLTALNLAIEREPLELGDQNGRRRTGL